ncbi:unnamed protein product, partial [marine sediment metagenome]
LWWWGMSAEKFLEQLPIHLERTVFAEEKWFLYGRS